MMQYEQKQIINIINKINKEFKETLLSLYSYSYQGNTDVYSYYLTGHCPSYAQILYNIFGDTETIEFHFLEDTRNGQHIVTKINGHFYDVRGNVDFQISVKPNSKFDYAYMGAMQEYYGNNDNIDCLLIHQLSEIGNSYKEKHYKIKKSNFRN